MKNRLPLSILILLLFITNLSGQTTGVLVSQLPSIPDKEGFAGMYAGVSNGALLSMGGANFPEGKPWEGGEKIWYDHIYVLENEKTAWIKAEQKLPNPLGYGVSVTYKDQVLLVGGSDADKHYSQVIGVKYKDGKVSIENNYPDLPVPLAMMSGTLVGNTIYIAGGMETPTGPPTKHFFALDLSQSQDSRRWEELTAWPGLERILSVAGAKDKKFYLFSGIYSFEDEEGKADRTILTDAYVFDPEENTWASLPEMPRGVAAAPNPAPIMGLNHILFPGGLDAERATHPDPKTHPGFLEDILSYNTLSKTYVSVGTMPPGSSRLTLPSTKWNETWVIPNGESGPGVRSPEVYSISNPVEFGSWNWLFLVIYLIGMVLLGFYFSKRENTTNDYFLAGQRIPWWAAGLSIYGTQLSAITFMAIPAVVYATDWTLAIGSLMIIILVPLIIKYYLPFFRRLNVTTAYEYLEERFDVKVRTLASVAFMLMQLVRMGIILYLPAIAISSVTGLDVYLCIALMGLISTAYTVMGGIEAVIWTDVVQVIVLMGGAIGCIVVAIWNVDGGLVEVVRHGMEMDKFRMFHWGWDPTRLVVWVAIVSFFFLNLIPYSSDQTVVQRYLTVKSEKEAAKSLWMNAYLIIPGILIFFGLGTVLFIYYFDNPAIINANKPDELLPYYIVKSLPMGLAGIVIAAIFAASMSSLDSSMNSIATAYTTDIHVRFTKERSDYQNLKLAKWMTVLIGLIGTGSAMFIAAANVEYIFDYFQALLGLFGGGLAGIFILAIFIPRANSIGAIAGLFGSAFVTWLISSQTDVTGYLYAAVGVMSCVVIGYLVSVIWPISSSGKSLTYSELVN